MPLTVADYGCRAADFAAAVAAAFATAFPLVRRGPRLQVEPMTRSCVCQYLTETS